MSARLLATVIAGTAVLVTAGSGTASGGAVTRLPALEQGLLGTINAVRSERGLPPLRAHRGLGRAALDHTRESARLGLFSHESADGTSLRERVARYYPRGASPGRWDVAENLQWRTGNPSAAAFVPRWMASRPHRVNLLTRRFRDVGIAAVHANGAGGDFGGRTITLVAVVLGVR